MARNKSKVRADLERERERGIDRHNDWRIKLAVIGAALLFASLFYMALVLILAGLMAFNLIGPGVALSNAPSAIISWIEHPADPTAGLNPNLAAELPGAIRLYLAAVIVAIGFVFGGRYGYRTYRRLRKGEGLRGTTRWAEGDDLRGISAPRSGTLARLKAGAKRSASVRHPLPTAAPVEGVVLGELEATGDFAVLDPESHALVVAGTSSGKTAGLCIPALLEFPGVIIATSVKADLVDKTIRERERLGTVFVFDPVGCTDYPSVCWSPLATASDWSDAQRTADSLITVALSQKGGSSSGNMLFFENMAKRTLPVLLYAAAVMDEDMRRVLKWLNRISDETTHDEVFDILEWRHEQGDPHAAAVIDAWANFVSTDQKLRGDIAATVQSALVCYEDPKVQASAMRSDITPEHLFDGRSNTLFVVAPMSEQARLEPIFVALMQHLFFWVSNQRSPLVTPCLAVLDEAANIAALPSLPELLSTIRSQRVQFITAWQDFSQIQARYGDKKNTILNNSRVKMILPGVSDPETLRYFADVTGETAEEQVSVSVAHGSRTRNVSEGRRALLTPAEIRQQKLGEGILLYGNLPPARLKMRMWFNDRKLKRLVEGG